MYDVYICIYIYIYIYDRNKSAPVDRPPMYNIIQHSISKLCLQYHSIVQYIRYIIV